MNRAAVTTIQSVTFNPDPVNAVVPGAAPGGWMTTPPTSLPGGGSSDPANAGVANHTMKHVAATETRPNFFMPPDPFSLIDNPGKLHAPRTTRKKESCGNPRKPEEIGDPGDPMLQRRYGTHRRWLSTGIPPGATLTGTSACDRDRPRPLPAPPQASPLRRSPP